MASRFDRLYFFFILNYLAQGLIGFAYEPVAYFLKDGLGLSSTQSARFVFWMTLPFVLKPLFALLTDLFPIAGRRRKPYLLIVSCLGTAAWVALAFLPRHSYAPVLALLIASNIGIMGADVVCDAVMVEQGKPERKTGVFQAAQIATLYLALIVTGYGGGLLAAYASLRTTFGLAAMVSVLFVVSAMWSREPSVPNSPAPGLHGLWTMIRAPGFYVFGAFIFLWSFYPFLGTAQFYYETNVLKLGPVLIGLNATLAGLSGALGAVFYGRTVNRLWTTPQFVKAAVVIGAPLSLLYFFYLGPVSVALLTVLFGFSGTAFRLALMDLAAQKSAAHAEATAFACYMAVFDLAAAVSNRLGGGLYETLQGFFAALPHPSYAAMGVLVLVGSACTAACWLLLPALFALPAGDPVRE